MTTFTITLFTEPQNTTFTIARQRELRKYLDLAPRIFGLKLSLSLQNLTTNQVNVILLPFQRAYRQSQRT
jgi:hypothetical protein